MWLLNHFLTFFSWSHHNSINILLSWAKYLNISLMPPDLNHCRCSPIRTPCTFHRVWGTVWAAWLVGPNRSQWRGAPSSSAWCRSPGSGSHRARASRWRPLTCTAPCSRASRCGGHPRWPSENRGWSRGKKTIDRNYPKCTIQALMWMP